MAIAVSALVQVMFHLLTNHSELQSSDGGVLVLCILTARVGGYRDNAQRIKALIPLWTLMSRLETQIEVIQCEHFLSVVNNECKGTVSTVSRHCSTVLKTADEQLAEQTLSAV